MESKLVRKARKILHNNKKRIYQSIRANKEQQSILFIVGCQRSGTTMMLHVFEGDLNTQCFAERSKLTSNDTARGIRLNSLDSIKKDLSKIKAPLIVIKPLVESQNTPKLLDYFSNSHAVWMYRNYKDVALSNIKQFGMDSCLSNLRPIINNDKNNWRAERVPEHVREIISRHFSEDMSPYDAAALFWFVRNSLYFDLNLDEDPRVILLKYEDFVVEPEKHMRAIYRQVGQEYPATSIASIVHSNSIKKGKDIEFSPDVEAIVRELQDKLEAVYQAKLLEQQDLFPV